MENVDNANNNPIDYGDITEYMHDTPEQIQMCLNCDKPECTNCLWANI